MQDFVLPETKKLIDSFKLELGRRMIEPVMRERDEIKEKEMKKKKLSRVNTKIRQNKTKIERGKRINHELASFLGRFTGQINDEIANEIKRLEEETELLLNLLNHYEEGKAIMCPGPKCEKIVNVFGGISNCSCGFMWCNNCHNKIEDEDEHACDPKEVVSMASEKEKETMCPNCKVVIYRPSGCDHMRCSQCKTKFGFRNGKAIYEASFDQQSFGFLDTLRNKDTPRNDELTSPFAHFIVKTFDEYRNKYIAYKKRKIQTAKTLGEHELKRITIDVVIDTVQKNIKNMNFDVIRQTIINVYPEMDVHANQMLGLIENITKT